jgi:hypothetical protein
LHSECDVHGADAALNDATNSVSNRILLNDVDGLVLISVLQAQIVCFYVVFVICLILLWLQYPLINPLTVKLVWNYLLHVFCWFFEPSKSQYMLSLFDISSHLSKYNLFNGQLVSFAFEILFIITIVWFLASTAFSAIVTFYRIGSDPIKADAAQPQQCAAVSDASGPPGTVHVSYDSPSNVILKSIKRFNEASVCARDVTADGK